MATTPAQLANQALTKVGQTKFLTSLNDGSTASKVVATVYGTARDTVLAARWWPFAKKTAPLAQINTTRLGWAYVYAAPSDMLVEREIWPGERAPRLGERIPMELQANDAGTGQVICTDTASASLVYTRRIEAIDAFPPDVREAFIWKLAAELVLALPVKPEFRRLAREEYESAISRAYARALNSSVEKEPDRISEFERIRGGGQFDEECS